MRSHLSLERAARKRIVAAASSALDARAFVVVEDQVAGALTAGHAHRRLQCFHYVSIINEACLEAR